MKFSVSGVFCHQKPYVKNINSNETCELGDLLIVYIENKDDTSYICNSILLQAKTTDKKQHLLYSKGDLIQLKLYSSWPTFEYTKAGVLNGIQRNITPKTFTLGAQYLLMQNNYDDEKLINTAHPSKELIPNAKLSKVIVDLLTFRTGRTFEYTHPSDDEWTNMIWDLIGNAKSAIYNRKKFGKVNAPRLTTVGDFFSPQLEFSVSDDIPQTTDAIDDFSFIPSIIIQGKSQQEPYLQGSLFG